MSEQVATPEKVETIVTDNNFNPFAGGAWSEEAPKPIVEEQPKKAEATTPAAEPAKPEDKPESTTVVNEWYKTYGWENEDAAKQEIENLKKPKEPEVLKFENDESKNIYELIRQGKRKEVKEYLDTQDRLETYTTADVTKDTAPEIIKLGMQLQNKLLTQDEIDFQYRQEFVAPKEPVQRTSESDEEFEERVGEWKERVSNIEMKKIVAAKMAIPELQKQKANIVLPEIQKQVTQEPTGPSQEELANLEKIRTSYLQTLESDFNKFNGYEAKYKDEEVEIPISFAITTEEKVALKKELESFDVNSFIEQRWFDVQNGAPKIEQIMSDVILLRQKENVFQKLVNEAATQMKEHQIKKDKNISLGRTTQDTFQPSGNQKQADPFAKGAWSETPPVLNNN